MLCDKPFGNNADDATVMEATARDADVPTLLNFEFRHHPGRARLRELVVDGAVGTVEHVQWTAFNSGSRQPLREYGWLFDASRGGGWVGAWGSHAIDFLRWTFGEIADAAADLHITLRERPDRDGALHPCTAEDGFTARMRTVGGATVTIDTTFAARVNLAPRITVLGSDGVLESVADGSITLRTDAGKEEVFRFDAPREDPHLVPMRAWAEVVRDAVRDGAVPDGEPTFADGLGLRPGDGSAQSVSADARETRYMAPPSDTVEALMATAGGQFASGDVAGAAAALDAWLADHDDPAAHSLRGAAYYFTDALEDAGREWELAFAGFRDRGERCAAARAAIDLAELHSGSLDHRAVAAGWLQRAQRLLDEVGPCVEVGYLELALMACDRPDVDDLERSTERALAIAREFGDTGLEVRALADSGLALVSQGRSREGFGRLDEALAAIAAGEVHDPAIPGKTFCAMLSSCDRAGDVRRAEEWTRVVDELVLDRIGGPRILHTHCQVAYGSVLLGAGRWSEAEAAIQGALGPEGSRSSGHRIDANARLAELRLDQGRTDEAAQLVALHPDDVATALPAARLHLLRGEHDLAVATIARARRALVGDTLRNAPLLALAVEVALTDGDLAGAERAALQLSELADHSESPVVRAEAEFARGRVQAVQGDLADATVALEAAARALADAQRPLRAATVRLELAEVLATSGDTPSAVLEARAAYTSASRIGAVRCADRAAALMRSLGATPARVAAGPAAVGALTRREAEVLALLPEGLTNAEIGARLFISVKTAEHHVGRVLAKLGVRSRAEAAAMAASVLAGSPYLDPEGKSGAK